ncbi:MAG TPA: ADP-polyphosphate phosphotransferase [Bacteroidales bacterium]|nr:ADP-polyphosphate phosphotransferase [Bacteroidales bacterium]
MKIKSKDFRVQPDEKVEISKKPSSVAPFFKSKKEYKGILGSHIKDMSALQGLLYAADRYSLLIILQGMDAAGKDGIIRHVMSGVNPQGCQVFSFKQPSTEELDHDFLWRTTKHLPERGRIGIFNRSYYEEVLVVRVHPQILENQKLPEELKKSGSLWKNRYRSITDFEEHLHNNGTRIIKIFLNLSKDEQKKRFLERIEDPEKNWKFSEADIKERQYWDEYMSAFGECLNYTSTKHSPWYVVPADDKKNARLIVSQIILDTLKSLKMSYPEPTPEQLAELNSAKEQLLG